MKGFRADFYNKDAALRSIEILEWAGGRSSFLSSDVRKHFDGQLAGYKDADHEVSERLRKLLKSGNIVVVTAAYVSAELAVGRLGGEEASELGLLLEQIEAGTGRGRKPRLYAISHAGRRYLTSRSADQKDGTEITSRGEVVASALRGLLTAVDELREADEGKAQAKAAARLFKAADDAREILDQENSTSS